MHTCNKTLKKIKDTEQLTHHDIFDLLNQQHTTIAFNTIERWTANPDNNSYIEMQGYWFDLLQYRLRDPIALDTLQKRRENRRRRKKKPPQ